MVTKDQGLLFFTPSFFFFFSVFPFLFLFWSCSLFFPIPCSPTRYHSQSIRMHFFGFCAGFHNAFFLGGGGGGGDSLHPFA